jgi:hypothetical protein
MTTNIKFNRHPSCSVGERTPKIVTLFLTIALDLAETENENDTTVVSKTIKIDSPLSAAPTPSLCVMQLAEHLTQFCAQ